VLQFTRGIVALWLTAIVIHDAAAQALQHPSPYLDYIYPAGGNPGQTIELELGGLNGFEGADRLLIDGPPGISVEEVQKPTHDTVKARIKIAPDAAPGRRLVRVAGGSAGLTNERPFFVGKLPELIETEPNNTSDQPQQVAIPAVINSRLQAKLDIDCFRFEGKAGQSIVAAVLAHGMDSTVRESFNKGFLDTSLELLDAQGQILAAAEDTVGLDPVVNLKLPADGTYIVRVKAVAYAGARSAVYRLTLGEVPYVTSVFPSGGQRGQTIGVELDGPNVPAGTMQKVTIAADNPFPLQDLLPEFPGDGSQVLTLVRGDLPESRENEPNNDRTTAGSLPLNSTANARFEQPADEDWYRFTAESGKGVILQTLAQRHLRAPVDTAIEIYDASGKKLAENDDGQLFMGQVWHDFESADSRLVFQPPTAGEYFIRVTNGSGIFGKQSIYRLTLTPLTPDFAVFQWPDAVSIWGANNTASFITQVFTWGGLDSDVEIRVEGLPTGWQSSVSFLPAEYLKIYTNTYIGNQALVTITSPKDAAVGTIVPIRVVAKATHEGKTIERVAQSMTLYGNSHNDRMFLRPSRGARAVVAPPLGCRLETSVTELTVPHGGTAEIPVRVEYLGEVKGSFGLGIDGSTVAAGTGWKAPTTLAAGQTEIKLPLTVSPEWRPGTYTIVVSRWWSADIRAGRPGPCTPAIKLTIQPPAAK
jgi:pre-peptidase